VTGDDAQLAMLNPTHQPEGAVCLSQHPTDPKVKCRRLAGHDGDHSSYTNSIRTPETWSAVADLNDRKELS